MTEHDVLQIIFGELRRARLPVPHQSQHPHEWQAYCAAARRIVSEAQTDQRHAARTASLAGFAVTRGRTRL